MTNTGKCIKFNYFSVHGSLNTSLASYLLVDNDVPWIFTLNPREEATSKTLYQFLWGGHPDNNEGWMDGLEGNVGPQHDA